MTGPAEKPSLAEGGGEAPVTWAWAGGVGSGGDGRMAEDDEEGRRAVLPWVDLSSASPPAAPLSSRRRGGTAALMVTLGRLADSSCALRTTTGGYHGGLSLLPWGMHHMTKSGRRISPKC